mgnify:CR=1 FL=1
MSRSSFIMAGTQSGVGKTSLTLGLARAFKLRGKEVQTFKVGPDYLDPSHLSLASGKACYNLDSWMTNSEYVSALYHKKIASAQIGLVEGVMGLFDGASTDSLKGSTAEIALILKRPVILVLDASGMARSFCAMVKGYVEFEKELKIIGVIANRVGSLSHGELLKNALAFDGLPPLLGAVPEGELATLPSRHLGLVDASELDSEEEILNTLATQVEKFLDLDLILNLTKDEQEYPSLSKVIPSKRMVLGVARDPAFKFTYADNLEALEQQGVELQYFSPMKDTKLSSHYDALYFPGGYPELYAKELSSNGPFISSLKDFYQQGKLIYAECGGLLYFCESLKTDTSEEFPLIGLVPAKAQMNKRLSRLGYAEASFLKDNPWGKKGDRLKGHVFHYSSLGEAETLENELAPFEILRRKSKNKEGFLLKNLMASYVHLHWASREESIEHFIQYALKCSNEARSL